MNRDLFINGEWLEAAHYADLVSPYHGRVIGRIPVATEEEVERALASAYQAKQVMAKMPSYKRAEILERLVSLLKDRFDEAAAIIATEAAKPMKAAKMEVGRTIETYKFAAEEAKRIHGETLPLDAAPGGENRLAYTVREPIGVIGAITPFNFPMNLVAHKVGPAVASGNTIVLKPSSQTPLSAFFIAELLHEAGLPPGAINVVTGSGAKVGNKIVTDDRVSMITFTGSPSVGTAIRSQAGLKRVTLELGSNSAVIIDQGVNLEKIVPRCVQGAFSFQGQVCISLQRIYVHEDIYESFVKSFVEETQNLRIGDPMDLDTDVSALISPSDTQRLLDWIEEAKASGVEVAAGGKTIDSVLQPTVLLGVDPSLKVSCQEAFGPIVVINKVKDMQEGIQLVNQSRFGLQAGIYTNDLHLSLQAAEQLHVGGVLINDIPTFRVDHMPYGGVKESGMGREGLKYAIEEMTELKLIIFNRN